MRMVSKSATAAWSTRILSSTRKDLTYETRQSYFFIASLSVCVAWVPLADAQERSCHETRSGVLEFEANGYPTDDTVRRI